MNEANKVSKRMAPNCASQNVAWKIGRKERVPSFLSSIDSTL